MVPPARGRSKEAFPVKEPLKVAAVTVPLPALIELLFVKSPVVQVPAISIPVVPVPVLFK